MPKHLDLCDFLATGDFFGVTGESTRADVSAILGEPDDVGNAACRHKLPRCWVFGGVELHFSPFAESTLELIHFDHPNVPPRGSASLTIEPWIVAENAAFDKIHAACVDAGIALSRRDGPIVEWVTSGGVSLTFSDDRDRDQLELSGVSLTFRHGNG